MHGYLRILHEPKEIPKEIACVNVCVCVSCVSMSMSACVRACVCTCTCACTCMCVCQCVDLRRSDRFRIERIKYTSRDLKNTRNVVSINFVCMYVHTYVRT